MDWAPACSSSAMCCSRFRATCTPQRVGARLTLRGGITAAGDFQRDAVHLDPASVLRDALPAAAAKPVSFRASILISTFGFRLTGAAA